MALPDKLKREFEALVQKYPERRAGLIPALHRSQEELGGWLSPETIEDLAAWFGLEPIDVYGVASFYPMFKLRPQGRHVVSICHNISCDLRGADDVIEHVCRITGAPLGGTSDDGRFSVTTVECQGACTAAPMFDLDGVYHENLDRERIEKILGGVR
jgi:NADH-quinone oxidoreductase subunit E